MEVSDDDDDVDVDDELSRYDNPSGRHAWLAVSVLELQLHLKLQQQELHSLLSNQKTSTYCHSSSMDRSLVSATLGRTLFLWVGQTSSLVGETCVDPWRVQDLFQVSSILLGSSDRDASVSK